MARQLRFALAGVTYDAGIEKVDRDKLYGWVKRQPFDRDGNPCYMGTLSGDGMHILGRGSLEQGYLDPAGNWVERDALRALDQDGTTLAKRESSFKETIALAETMSLDDYLLHTAKLVYQLDAPLELIVAVAAREELYTFPFNYVASYAPDTAFLIESDGILFLIVGQPTGFDYVGLTEVEPTLLIDDDEEEEEGADSFDFSMM